MGIHIYFIKHLESKESDCEKSLFINFFIIFPILFTNCFLIGLYYQLGIANSGTSIIMDSFTHDYTSINQCLEESSNINISTILPKIAHNQSKIQTCQNVASYTIIISFLYPVFFLAAYNLKCCCKIGKGRKRSTVVA